MENIGELFQSADWKKEKHVPVIECPDKAKPEKIFEIKVSIGKEITHPNTTEHHIRWIKLLFKPEGGKFPYHVGTFEFCAHGEPTDGPNTGPIYTHHSITASMKTSKPGTLLAMAYCNIHGLWQSSKAIKLS